MSVHEEALELAVEALRGELTSAEAGAVVVVVRTPSGVVAKVTHEDIAPKRLRAKLRTAKWRRRKRGPHNDIPALVMADGRLEAAWISRGHKRGAA